MPRLTNTEQMARIRDMASGLEESKQALMEHFKDEVLCDEAEVELVELFEAGNAFAKEVLLAYVPEYSLCDAALLNLMELVEFENADAEKVLFRCKGWR